MEKQSDFFKKELIQEELKEISFLNLCLRGIYTQLQDYDADTEYYYLLLSHLNNLEKLFLKNVK